MNIKYKSTLKENNMKITQISVSGQSSVAQILSVCGSCICC